MTIEQADVVDLIGVEKATGKVVLSIVGHLDWEDGPRHIELLVQKLNRYIGFLENGELFESYPDSRGRKIVFALLHLYPLSQEGFVLEFLANLRETLGRIDVELQTELLPQERPS